MSVLIIFIVIVTLIKLEAFRQCQLSTVAGTLKPQKLGRVLEDPLYVLRSIIHSTKPDWIRTPVL